MNCDCKVRRGLVYLPTWAKTVDGVYVAQEPMAVIAIADTAVLERAFREKFIEGNPQIPRPDFRTLKRVFEIHAGVKSWSAFERGMTSWSVNHRNGAYDICICRRERNGSWVEDGERKIVFPKETTLDQACRRFVEILQAEHGAA